jgi:phosphatidate cytidylyltransferase
VADDKQGDDLFEDLDKFFAPIKDVDWDEPDETASAPPREEHVAVRETQEPTDVGSVQVPASSGGDEGDEAGDEAGHEEWYDAGPSAIDEILKEPTDVDDVRIVEDAPASSTDQTDLFETPETGAPSDEGADDDGVGGGFWEHDDEEAPVVAESDEPIVVAGDLSDDEPTEEDLEAAAEHFADSVRADRYDTEPAGFDDEGGPSSGAELLTELGADEVEQDILSDLEEREHAAVIVGTEGITGPSWQEPATVEVGADLERRGPDSGERDVPAAFLTGTLLAGLAVASLLIGPGAFAIVATVVVLAAQGELFGLMVRGRHQPATAVGLVTGALIMIGAYYRGVEAIPAMLALGLVATFLWYLTVPAMQRKNILLDAGLTMLNVVWIPVLAGYLIALSTGPEGTELVIAVVGLTFAYDTAAFLAGTVVGGAWFRRGMAPGTSPKKSWEGFILAAFATVFISVSIVTSFVAPFNDRRIDTMLLGLVVVVAATLGDLAESLVKRDLDVKDMSTILPGHGGVLDRIDSLLFVAPASYLLLGVLDIV